MERDDVAQALTAHPRWVWRAGVRIVDGYRLDAADEAHGRVDGVPDLDDPATGGVVLGMLAEACRVHPTVTPRVDGGLSVGAMGSDHLGPTLGVAAARALLAAWGPA